MCCRRSCKIRRTLFIIEFFSFFDCRIRNIKYLLWCDWVYSCSSACRTIVISLFPQSGKLFATNWWDVFPLLLTPVLPPPFPIYCSSYTFRSPSSHQSSLPPFPAYLRFFPVSASLLWFPFPLPFSEFLSLLPLYAFLSCFPSLISFPTSLLRVPFPASLICVPFLFPFSAFLSRFPSLSSFRCSLFFLSLLCFPYPLPFSEFLSLLPFLPLLFVIFTPFSPPLSLLLVRIL